VRDRWDGRGVRRIWDGSRGESGSRVTTLLSGEWRLPTRTRTIATKPGPGVTSSHSSRPATNAYSGKPRQPQKRLSAEELTGFRADYLSGLEILTLAERYGINRDTAICLARRHALPRRRVPMSSTEIEQAIQLYQSGLSLAKVATHFPCNPSTIWRAFKRLNVPMRDPQGR